MFSQVYDPHDAVVDQQTNKPKGTFGFTTKVAGDFKACFTAKGMEAVLLLQIYCYILVSSYVMLFARWFQLIGSDGRVNHESVVLMICKSQKIQLPMSIASYVDPVTARDTKLSLEWKTGVSATNWDDVAKKENLDVMATELRKLEDSVKEIHQEMLYLRRREEQMRNLSGTPPICKSLRHYSGSSWQSTLLSTLTVGVSCMSAAR
jgi:hypothetical protein